MLWKVRRGFSKVKHRCILQRHVDILRWWSYSWRLGLQQKFDVGRLGIPKKQTTNEDVLNHYSLQDSRAYFFVVAWNLANISGINHWDWYSIPFGKDICREYVFCIQPFCLSPILFQEFLSLFAIKNARNPDVFAGLVFECLKAGWKDMSFWRVVILCLCQVFVCTTCMIFWILLPWNSLPLAWFYHAA